MEREISTNKRKIRKLTIFSMLAAVCIILGVTPLGIIPVPPVGATIIHIPVIIMAILEGPILGALMGLVFGVISFTNSFLRPSPTSFVLWNPLVSIMPRIFIGLVAYYGYKYCPIKKESIKIALSAILSTLTNTVGLLGMMYLLYGDKVAIAFRQNPQTIGKYILILGITHGIPEILLAVFITIPIVLAIKKIKK